jgi:hypothetical protein
MEAERAELEAEIKSLSTAENISKAMEAEEVKGARRTKRERQEAARKADQAARGRVGLHVGTNGQHWAAETLSTLSLVQTPPRAPPLQTAQQSQSQPVGDPGFEPGTSSLSGSLGEGPATGRIPHGY